MVLKERLNVFGIVGCMLCIVGSITIVLHAPEEQPITSLLQVWRLALQPGKHPQTFPGAQNLAMGLSLLLQNKPVMPNVIAIRDTCGI